MVEHLLAVVYTFFEERLGHNIGTALIVSFFVAAAVASVLCLAGLALWLAWQWGREALRQRDVAHQLQAQQAQQAQRAAAAARKQLQREGDDDAAEPDEAEVGESSSLLRSAAVSSSAPSNSASGGLRSRIGALFSRSLPVRVFVSGRPDLVYRVLAPSRTLEALQTAVRHKLLRGDAAVAPPASKFLLIQGIVLRDDADVATLRPDSVLEVRLLKQ